MNKVRAAIYSGMVLLLGTFFAVWNELITVKTVVMVLVFLWELCIIITIGIGAIVIGWFITELFKWASAVFAFKWAIKPDPKLGWEPQKPRLMLCSFFWTALANHALLSLRYVYADEWRALASTFSYITVWTLVVGAASLPTYDIVVKRWWPGLLRAVTPRKRVQTPTGIEERDITVPSGDGEKTLLPDREE